MNIVKLQDIKLTQIPRIPIHEQWENREIKETIQFTIAMKRIKYLGIYLPKETKDLYIYKIIKHGWKKSKRTLIDGEIYHVHGFEESIQWKWVYYPKKSIDSMQSLSSYQWYFSEN